MSQKFTLYVEDEILRFNLVIWEIMMNQLKPVSFRCFQQQQRMR